MRNSLNTIKLKNPSSQFADLENFKIEASHIYIKFKPKTIEEESILKNDSTLYLFDYRLDCEYKDGFLEKRKATNDTIPDYYTAISVDRPIPNVPFEVIDELYIPEQDAYFNDTYEQEKYLINYQINDKTDLFNHLIYDAFVNTGNEEEVIEPNSTPSQRWFFGKRWRPAGTIRIWDVCRSELVSESFTPLEGAKILMRQWFTIDSGITNSDGYFSTGLVRGRARYILQWERYQYSIRTGNFGQAELRGPKLKREDWNEDIQGGMNQFYGHIHRGAFHYYYKNIKNLRRPPQNGFWKPQMKIGGFDETGNVNGNYRCSARFMGILPAIRIYNPNNTSCEIYATTIHELAHASHFNMKKSDYRPSDDKVKESWARGVQWDLTRMTYPNYVPSEFRPKYTLVVKDMIDGLSGYDQVTGYDIRQIEDALLGNRTWNEWKDNIKNSYTNATENNLDALFNYWN